MYELAAQTLIATNANILNNYYGPETIQTALYCTHMTNFFDCLNVKSTKEGDYSRNEFLKPYMIENDFQFDWLQNTLLPYFNNWKHCHILIIGNIFYRDLKTLQPVLGKKCLFLDNPMWVYKLHVILLLKPTNIY